MFLRLLANLAVLCITASAFAEPVPESVLGVYARPQKSCFTSAEGEWCEGFRNETIAIRRRTKELAYVGVDLIFFNGHRCSYYGVGRWRDGKLVASSSNPFSRNICRLEVSIDGTSASFKKHSGDCDPVGFCSARGSLSGGRGFIREP